MSVLNLIRPELLNSQVYLTNSGQINHRLHANELPWSALKMETDLNFYPEKMVQEPLLKQLATLYQVEVNQLVLTRGSDDGIDLITRLFLSAGQDSCMQFPPTFSMYSFYAHLQQAQLINCPLDPLNCFEISVEEIRNRWQENCKIIILCNPNNPTASLINIGQIAALCEEYKDRSMIVVDEAYIEFTQNQSATCLIPQFDNLIILRTLSKAYGLANLRLGGILAQAHVIQALNKVMPPFPLSTVVINLALKALAKQEWFSESIKKIRKARTQLIQTLTSCPLIKKVYPSQTNFILIKTLYAAELAMWLNSHGIAVKNFPIHSSLPDHLRITVGNEAQNILLLNTLSSFQPNSSLAGCK
ncbi:histidinol-phosphate transaminase [Legionella longbeachae]|uniref:histidinol-phosphate transaminase n=1 Tax=Legionella longbeachae serogroup 1 (strain NSW150) TaxID=661367 RepID=D3HRY3_LEGLN|nr:histidinol-phosphate transaminase [Legionella longbeachae]VEE02164.1 Histidinol-phosphate aminotransferase (Imidazole acetol-phosphate transaminase) [Legionella oakridgensis]HBD7396593.1 histidinol-phosphate transaminase [Legionella pneumophila]ARB91534.1 histidinol-phosphate transaminase [Legionella longbeachae]EEZ95209.1 histidinol-phosphate aminotransferase [Legionella longbeachae D-4968]QIN32046.1 histidinol-phosphate transaminase [Legionella longbeachae]